MYVMLLIRIDLNGLYLCLNYGLNFVFVQVGIINGYMLLDLLVKKKNVKGI